MGCGRRQGEEPRNSVEERCCVKRLVQAAVDARRVKRGPKRHVVTAGRLCRPWCAIPQAHRGGRGDHGGAAGSSSCGSRSVPWRRAGSHARPTHRCRRPNDLPGFIRPMAWHRQPLPANSSAMLSSGRRCKRRLACRARSDTMRCTHNTVEARPRNVPDRTGWNEMGKAAEATVKAFPAAVEHIARPDPGRTCPA